LVHDGKDGIEGYMQRFWEVVLEPVLDAVHPKVIVEIGSDQGCNTSNLLEYCRHTGGTLHVVDPAPKYDVSELRSEHADHLVFHEVPSLRALPSIENCDVVLIDGDHNWYTVLNELKTIERLCEEGGQRFPLVLLHDIGWPYGRRDLYYDPDSVPEEHRKPYARKGMLPGVRELVDEGGMNRHLNNALREHEPKEGVLTAVEDFLGASRYELDLLELPGIHGLGILTPAWLKRQNPNLARLLDELDFSPFVARYVQGIERARLELQIRQQAEQAKHVRHVKEIEETWLEERREHTQRLAEESRRLREERQKLNLANEKVMQLTRWLEMLDRGTSSLLRSRQWMLGSIAGEAYRRATFKGEVSTPDEHLEETLQKFRTWRMNETEQDPGMKGGADE
jgi:Methyltransferase domain